MTRGKGGGFLRWLLPAGAALLAMWATPVGAQAASPVQSSGTGSIIHTHPSLHNKASAARGATQSRSARAKDSVALATAKSKAAMRAATAPASPRSLAPAAAAAAPPTFSGLTAAGLQDGSFTPSDSTGDVSPTHYMEVVNTQIGAYDRNLTLLASTSLAAFGGVYGGAAGQPNDCMSDPQIAWDQQANRWEYTVLDETTSAACGAPVTPTGEFLAFGWSQTSDPLGNWCGFALNTGTFVDDYAKLGHNDTFMTVGANQFGNYGASFAGSIVIALVKPPAGSTACATPAQFTFFNLTNRDGTPIFTPVPVDTTDSSGLEYVISAEDPGTGQSTALSVFHLVGSAASASLYPDPAITVPAFAVPPPVPQPSTGTGNCGTTGNCIDSLDGRLTQAVAHFDPAAHTEAVWTQHAVSDSSVSALSVERWYEVIPGQSAPRQLGSVTPGDPTLYVFNGAVSPTEAGNEAVIFYNTANGSPTGFVDYRTQRRNSAMPLGTMGGELVIASSTVSDADMSCGVSHQPAPNGTVCRWGDYSGARPDPANANTVWGTGMLVGSPGGPSQAGWVTQIARVTPGCSTATLSGPASALGGAQIQYTASSTDCSNPLYQFWIRNSDGSWLLGQAFSASNTWTWNSAGYSTGSNGQLYPVVVWATQSGDSQTTWDAYAQTNTTLTVAPPCGQAGLNGPASGEVGSSITFTASVGASTCPGPLFQFWILPPGGSWTVTRPFNSSATWAWDTTNFVPGSYSVAVWANQSGHSQSTFESVAVVNLTLTGCATVNAPPSPAQPQVVGTPVTIQAASTGCSKPLFQFWMLAPGSSTWQDVQSYSQVATYQWNSTASSPVGMYRWVVWAKETGSGGAAGNVLGRWDAITSFTYNLTSGACTGAGYNAAPTSPQLATTKVTITGTATGCAHASPSFQFWLLAPGGSWQDVQPYSTTASFVWDTTGLPPGTYSFNIWVRDAASAGTSSNSLGTWDSYIAFTYQITNNTCSSVTATSSPPSPATQNTTVTITAKATGCISPVFEFWRLDPNSQTWVKVQPYSNNSVFTWDTTPGPKGTYSFIVFVRDKTSYGPNSNSVARWDAYYQFTYTVT